MLVQAIPFRDPVAAFAPFADDPVAALLGGGGGVGDQGGRYSYLAIRPYRVISAATDGVRVDGVAVPGDPFTVLAEALGSGCKPGRTGSDGPVPFLTGAVGYFGYELNRHLERLPPIRPETLGVPDMVIGLYDLIVAFDHHRGEAWIIGRETEDAARGRDGCRPSLAARAQALAAALRAAPPLPALNDLPAAGPLALWRADLDRAAYEARVAAIIEDIWAGEIFQANFTQAFRAQRPDGLTPYTLFRRLLARAPAPYAAFLACGPGVHLAGVSPERFIGLDRTGRLETRPIKGTRPRGRTPEEDLALLADLVSSAKDRAENLMICDLLRNDLGRVCTIGSVRAPQRMAPETFAAVHHLVSVIQGQLRAGLGPVDVLRATFPGGSVTGAPKVRAMEIIEAYEASRRGPYCGAVGWIGFDGAMDTAVTIRTLTLAHGHVIAQAGGGIVAESDPAAEYREMMAKIEPLLAVLGAVNPS